MDKYYARPFLEYISGIPSRLRNFVLDVVDEKQAFLVDDCDKKAFEELSYIKDNIELFVDKNCNLLISSKRTGNGKSSYALYLAYNYTLYKHGKYYFVNVPELIYLSKQAMNDAEAKEKYDEMCRHIKNDDLIIWDDVVTATYSDYENKLMYVLINSRDGANIFTSNMIESEFLNSNIIDKRLADRITDGTCVEFNAISYRGKSFRSLVEENK